MNDDVLFLGIGGNDVWNRINGMEIKCWNRKYSTKIY